MNLQTPIKDLVAGPSACAIDLAHYPPFRLGAIEVQPALLRLKTSDGATRSIQPLVMRVLIALAEAGGETCSRDDLVIACWNQRIVGDDAVNRIISTLRRDLGQLSGQAVTIETIPKVGYRLKITDTASEAEGTNAPAAPRQGGVARPWLAAWLLALGAVSAGGFAATRASSDITAIAVVADAGSASDESARFADGLTGDLARLASAMPSLAFVEPGGTLSREPLRLRVAVDPTSRTPMASVRLVDSKNGVVVWSREFNAEGGTMAELRERVANGITGVVQCGLDRSAAFDDPVGLRLYLGACEGLETGDFTRARAFAQQIAEFRPDSPSGWACLANTTIFSEAEDGTIDDAVLERAETYARRALAADAKSGLAYVALAMASGWRGKSPLAILERGLRVDPDFAMLHKHYALALSGAGLVSDAVAPALRAVALQPHDPDLYRIAVGTLVNAGRSEEALVLSEKMRRLWRYDPGVEMQRLDMLFYAPDAKAALVAFSASPLHNAPPAGRIREALVWRTAPGAYDWSRFDRTARKMFAEDPSLAWRLSASAARMGDQARALDWLARAPPETYNGWWPLYAPEAAELRRDPRFFAQMARVGMVARWQKSGRWPDFCADPELPYDCRKSAIRLARSSVPGG